MTPKLSILVPTLFSRLPVHFPRLMRKLERQAGQREDVEVLALFDNKTRSVGMKRNALLDLARGEYTVFIDDDDVIAPDYVQSIKRALECNPGVDCVSFHVQLYLANVKDRLCKYRLGVKKCKNTGTDGYIGHISHVHPWRAEIAKQFRFPDKSVGEDVAWSKRCCAAASTEVVIDRVLYNYMFNNAVTETRHETRW